MSLSCAVCVEADKKTQITYFSIALMLRSYGTGSFPCWELDMLVPF